MIKVEGIRKVFNAHSRNANEVLKGVSFELPDKGLVAIFGKSGSGKTTLLNIIGGLDKQASGKIYIDGEDVAGKVDHIRNAKIGFIFQNYYLEAGYTIAEIMRNAMLIAGFKDEKEIASRTEQVLKIVKMDRYKHKTADSLSGGQKQRVAIARALVKGSDIILADEPTGNLDAENTTITMDILKEISKTQLVVLVTHEVNLIYKYADSHIKLVDGELREDGELDAEIEVDERKHNIYVNSENKRTYNIDNTNIDIYGEGSPEADIELFTEDGTVYLRPGKGVKVIDSKSEKKVIFEGTPEATFEVSDNMPVFSKSTAKKNGRLFHLGNILKSAKNGDDEKAYSAGNIFKNIFVVVMAVVLSFFALFTFEAVSNKPFNKNVNENSVFIKMSSYDDLGWIPEDRYDRIDFFELHYRDGEFAFSNQQSMDSITLKYEPTPIVKDKELKIKGNMPKSGEVLITRVMAEELKRELRQIEYQSDSAIMMLTFDKKYKVSGIVEESEPHVYMNRVDYVNFIGVYKELAFRDGKNLFFEKEFINKDTSETINSYRAEICIYDGTTLDLKTSEAVIEINRSSTYLMMGDSKDADYKIDTVNRILLKSPENISIANSYPVSIKQFSLNRTEMNTDIKVYVTEEMLDNIFMYINPNMDEEECFFEIKNQGGEMLKALNEHIDERGLATADVYGIYEIDNKEAADKMLGTLMIFIVAEILLFIIFFFMEKSASIKNSKEYGVFRAIGVNKSNLLYKEMVLAFKNNIIVYAIAYVAILILMVVRYSMMNVAMGIFIGLSVGMMIAGALVMMLISIIPYLFVLVKTPSEILSRYDI